MTNPLFYTPDVTGVTADMTVTLDAAASGHAVRSQRLQSGDAVLLSDGAGTLAVGTIAHADPQHTTVDIGTVEVQAPPAVRINLVQALAKGDRDLLAAEMGTEIGVDSVTPWQAQRSIVRIRAERATKMLGKWEAKLHAAAQQSRRAFIPQLREPLHGSSIATLQDTGEGQHLVVLHEDGQHDLSEVLERVQGLHTIHLVVGPEGGVAPEELAAVENVKGSAVKIGANVLRASTAGPVAITLINQFLNRW
ncbi:16S rRNA (uracil(1498)-N(3))-methyltransferase [Yaniella flava]|uniref:Ribosomal RNA small subunit methyltransferase E n=1 Tax=Yaniella flava TaxID=287930 RepID=A0ABP5FX49_9MICC